MTAEKTSTDTLVVGGGQAGVAMSEHLTKLGVPHLVLERDRIAERWRTGRWDSLVANGPAWHDRFPGMEFDDLDPDGFASKDRVADYFEAYAKKFEAPIRTGVEVKKVARNAGRQGFTIETSEGVIEANAWWPRPDLSSARVIPPIAPKAPEQSRRSTPPTIATPSNCPKGGVLVVGAGSSGVQIADELQRAGQAGLPVGGRARPPAARLSRPRLLLVAGRARRMGRGSHEAGPGTRDHRGQRRAWRPYGRLPSAGRIRASRWSA